MSFYRQRRFKNFLIVLLGVSFVVGVMNNLSSLRKQEAKEKIKVSEKVLDLYKPPDKFLGEFVITAYSGDEKSCGKWADGYFADGSPISVVGNMTVVAAPKEFPFGTLLYVEGIGEVIVKDRGGAIKGKRLDLFFHKHRDAIVFGRVNRMVWLRRLGYGNTRGGRG